MIERPARQLSAPAPGEPRFQMSASDRGLPEGPGRERLLVRQAFISTQPVASRAMFAGRRNILQRLIRSVEDQQAHVVLYGQRGIGKTSLLRVFAEAAEAADYFVVHRNCGSVTNFDELFRSIAARVPLLYHSSVSPSEAQSGQAGTLADLLPSTCVGPRQVSSLFAELTGTRSIIILDEFDRVQGSEFQAQIAELIKDLSDASARVQLVIGGIAKNLRDILGHSPSIRRNVMALVVERMPDEDILEIVSIGERHSELSFAPDARAAIVDYAHGFPYIARLVCHFAALAVISAARTNVVREDIDGALADAVEELEARLRTETRTAARKWLESEPKRMFEVARAGVDRGGWFEPKDLAALCGELEEDARSLLEKIACSNGMLVTAEIDGSDHYSLNEEDGLSSYLLLATAAARSRSA